MAKLPLFPLNLVLFPGMPVMLHIFEPRYKKMMGKCIVEGSPFGILLIKRGTEALGPIAETYNVGCTAQIVKVEDLTGGRKNILATGGERFIVSSYNRKNEYLIGDVEYLELVDEDSQTLDRAGDRLFPLINQYLDLLSTSSIIQTETLQLPSDPVEMAYMGAFLLQIDSRQKQRLLELVSGIELIKKVHKHYLREIPLAKALLDAPPPGSGLEGRMN